MHIVVCLKQIIDPEIPPHVFQIDPVKKKQIRGRQVLLISDFDAIALEVALQLKEKADGKVTAITIGAAEEEEEEWRQKITDAMVKRVSFDFVETPLPDVITFLHELTGVDFVLDRAALQDQEGLKEKASMTNEGRDYIESELSKINGLTVYHTHGNYILIDATPTGATSAEIVNAVMEKNGIILRKMNPFKDKTGLFRITIGSKEENERCVEAVNAFFNSRT